MAISRVGVGDRVAPGVRHLFQAVVWLVLAWALPLQAAQNDEEASSQEESYRALLDPARTSAVDTRAPAVRLETVDGETIDLADLYGRKAVYLKFWATWCGPCRAQMPHFERVYQNAGDDLAVIGINVGFNETLEDILEFREQYGIHMPIAVDDGVLAGALNLRITPLHVIIGKDGIIHYVGQRLEETLEQALEQARAAPARVVAESGRLARGSRLEVGDLLPGETLNTSDGDSFTLPDPAGQAGTVLVFMLPWCESYLANSRPDAGEDCRQVREQVEALRQRVENVRWLGVSSGLWTLKSDLNNYRTSYNTTLPLALDADNRLFRAFGVVRVPTIIVTDAAGRIVKRVDGYDPALDRIVSSL